jgi:DNA-binding transcriptional LysR family regulator
MELRHMRYFVEVAVQGHMTKAAEVLGIQQPPLSSQIKDLEKELGFELFHRHPKGMRLTKAGDVFYSSSVEILKSLDTAISLASRTHLGLEGELIIGVTTSVAAHHLFSNLIKTFRGLYPRVELKIIENNAETLTEQLLSNHLNLALLRLPVLPSPELEETVLLHESVMLALPREHPLLKGRGADASPPLSIKDLHQEQFILVRKPGSPGIYENLLTDCRLNGFEPQVVAEVDNMLTNINLVAAGVGISVVPASMSCFHQHAVMYCPLEGALHVKAPITLLKRIRDDSWGVSNFIKAAHQEAILIESH